MHHEQLPFKKLVDSVGTQYRPTDLGRSGLPEPITPGWITTFRIRRICSRQNWFVCQDGPFIQQLNEGVRAFDVRLHADEHWLGIKKFHTFHGLKLFRGRALSELVKSLNVFLSDNLNEFIVLDIHELKGINNQLFDYKGLHEVISTELAMIPRNNSQLTIEQLKRISPVQRVVLASDSHPDFRSPLYWPKIRH
jgi:1-phosphatidylinositol phosphodiesterase